MTFGITYKFDCYNMQERRKKSTIGQSRYKFVFNPENPLTLIMLKKSQEMGYLKEEREKMKKIFPNFYLLHKPEVANMQKITLYSMLVQQTDKHIMVEQFCQLARMYCQDIDQCVVSAFQSRFKGSDVRNPEQILRQYSQESFFYHLLNNLLRAARDPFQLYYSQYFTKLMHQSIKEIHQKQKCSNSFTCYRGASFAKEQIEELKQNIGKHIQTLGFLSTSKYEGIAKSFSGNTLIEIEVNNTPMLKSMDSGYVELNNNRSDHAYEGQILFNVLSSFQILHVQQEFVHGNNFCKVKLKYGATYQILHKYDQDAKSIASQDQYVIPLILKQQLFFKLNFNMSILDIALHLLPNKKVPYVDETRMYIKKSMELLQSCGVENKRAELITLLQIYLQQIYLSKKQKTQQELEEMAKFQNKYIYHQIQHLDAHKMMLNVYLIINQIISNCVKASYSQLKNLILVLKLQLDIARKYFDGKSNHGHFFHFILQICSEQKYFDLLDVSLNVKLHQNNLSQLRQDWVQLMQLKKYFLSKYGKFHGSHYIVVASQKFISKILGQLQGYNQADLQLLKYHSLIQSSKFGNQQLIFRTKNQIREVAQNGRYQRICPICEQCLFKIMALNQKLDQQLQYECLQLILVCYIDIQKANSPDLLSQLLSTCLKAIRFKQAPILQMGITQLQQSLNRVMEKEEISIIECQQLFVEYNQKINIQGLLSGLIFLNNVGQELQECKTKGGIKHLLVLCLKVCVLRMLGYWGHAEYEKTKILQMKLGVYEQIIKNYLEEESNVEKDKGENAYADK